MNRSENSRRLKFTVFFCLIFIYACGDSSKEVKVDKNKGAQKSTAPAAPPAPESVPEPESPAVEAGAEAVVETEVELAPIAEPAMATGPAEEPTSQPEAEVKTDAGPEVAANPVPVTEPVVKPASAPSAKPAPKPEAKPAPQPEAKPAPQPEAKPTAKVVKTSGQCPQPRKTKSAPASIAKMDKTGGASVAKGKLIYAKTAKPMACKMCHGDAGDGGGKLGAVLKPPPINFTCADTMKGVSAGQMFWIIKDGSKGTGMVAHGKTLKDADIWNVVKFIRSEFMD